MEFVLWIVFGALVGWIASMIMGTNAQQGALLNIIVGIIGAVIGGWIMRSFGQEGVEGFSIYSFVVALIGACILIGLVKLVRRTA